MTEMPLFSHNKTRDQNTGAQARSGNLDNYDYGDDVARNQNSTNTTYGDASLHEGRTHLGQQGNPGEYDQNVGSTGRMTGHHGVPGDGGHSAPLSQSAYGGGTDHSSGAPALPTRHDDPFSNGGGRGGSATAPGTTSGAKSDTARLGAETTSKTHPPNSQALREMGEARARESAALQKQSAEIAQAEKLEKDALEARERAVAHGAHPLHGTLGGQSGM